MENPQALGGKLLSRLVEIGTLFAKRFPTITSADIFALNVVACIAVRIVVVNGLLDRVPWRFLRHCIPPLFTRYARKEATTTYRRVQI